MRKLAIAVVLAVFVLPVVQAQRAAPRARAAAAPAPVIVVDTVKGAFEITLMPSEAPKSVAHILDLVKNHFYRGLRVHRVEATLVQFGDPATRNMTLRDSWGTGGSDNPIGVAEITKSMKHVRGAVGLADTGNPRSADSQMYIMKVASPGLDGKHIIIGHVTKGMDVVDKLQVPDIIKSITIK